jgi:gluconolactonase
MEWKFDLVAGPYGGVTEGPTWDGESLLFTNIHNSIIFRYDPRSGEVSEFRRYTNRTNGLAFGPDGRLFGCQSGSRRMVEFKPDGSTAPLEYRLDGHFHNQPNDLAIDSQGRIWFSDPWSQTPPLGPRIEPMLDHASVLRLEQRADRSWFMRRMTFDTKGPNGVLLSKDGRALYVAESMRTVYRRELRAYPVLDDGNLGPYTVLHTFGDDHRGPQRGIDGMCLDSDGNIVACAGSYASGPGPMIYVFSPQGRVLETHPVPVDMPTNCTWGGPDLSELYVTTLEGHLFRVRETGRKGWLIYPPAS